MNELDLFAAAIELTDPAEREELLGRECANRTDLRRRLELLLDAHDRSNSMLDRPAVADPGATFSHAPPSPLIGKVISGRFKLLEQIGDGGMGTVWMAEQREPVRRLVAVKLIKAGMDSKAVLARFEAERQALALMDHPNIAKVLDGGSTDDGHPFFVMELVRGLPLTEYCDARKLSVVERLELFVQICSAVQHAHQKAVIHRDLKPSNVLVTEHDGKPVPKVIDFGLAKALNASNMLTERTLHTAFGTVVGTPLYMAPEQVGINALDVDTRTDIYALGVILYELLTGSTPLEKARFKEAAWEEVKRLIRDEEPPRPSTRLSSDKTLPSLAASRQVEPSQLRRLVRGDLDWIVMKALDKDRGRRYETANGLSKDVQRYLQGDAVEACPPTFGYRLRTTFRRHRAAILNSGAFVAVLLIGIAVSTWQAIRATNLQRSAEVAQGGLRKKTKELEAVLIRLQEQRTLAESRLDQLLKLLDEQLPKTDSDTPETQRIVTKEQRRLAEIVIKYYQDLLEQPGTDPKTQSEIAAAALKVAYLQEQIGNELQAISALNVALPVLKRLSNESPDELSHRSQLANCHVQLGDMYVEGNHADKALNHLQTGRELLNALAKDAPDTPNYRLRLAHCQLTLAHALSLADKSAGDAPLREISEALNITTELTELDPKNTKYLFGLLRAKQNKIVMESRLGVADSRMTSLKELVGILQRQLEAPNVSVSDRRKFGSFYALSLHNLARSYQHTSELRVAEQLYNKGIEVLEKIIKESPGDLYARRMLGRFYVSRGITQAPMGQDHLDQAIADVQKGRQVLQETLNRVGQPVPSLSFNIVIAEGCLGRLLRDSGDLTGSMELIQQAITTTREIDFQDPFQMHGLGTKLYWLGELAITNDRSKCHKDALENWKEAIKVCEDSKQRDAALFYTLGELATRIQSKELSPDAAVMDAEALGFPGEPVDSFDRQHLDRQYLVVRFYAIAALHSPPDGETRNKYAEIAIDRLKTLVRQIGPCFVDMTPGNVDFDILRSYDSFKQIDQSIKDKMDIPDPEVEEILAHPTNDCTGP